MPKKSFDMNKQYKKHQEADKEMKEKGKSFNDKASRGKAKKKMKIEDSKFDKGMGKNC